MAAPDLEDLQANLQDSTMELNGQTPGTPSVSLKLQEDDDPDASAAACISLASTQTTMVPCSSTPMSSIPATPATAMDATVLGPLHSIDEKVFPAIVAPECAVFSKRLEVSGKASRHPFEASEAARAEDGSDDGVRVQLRFSVHCLVSGTSLNGVYHPAGTCNARRAFRRSIGGGGCPPLYLYHLPEKDCWGVGQRRGDLKVYAVCGPGGNPGEQLWHVWDGSDWVPNPADVAAVVYRADYQTARWEDQAAAGQACSDIKKALVGHRRQVQEEENRKRMERIRSRTLAASP